MEINIETQKPTFASKQDKLLQLVQYYVAIQDTKNLPEEHEEKCIDIEFEEKFEAIITNEALIQLWNIYENNVGVVECDVDMIGNVAKI